VRLRRRVNGMGEEEEEEDLLLSPKERWVGGRRRRGVGGLGRMLGAGEG
jgi:hypothetical protein